jgi:hypothetical protein
MLTLGDILSARVAAQIAIAWHDERPSDVAEAELARMQQLIRKLDELLDTLAPGIKDEIEYDEEMIALVLAQRSIH